MRYKTIAFDNAVYSIWVVQGFALLSAMIYSPLVLTGVCFLVGSLYVLHGMGQLGVVQTVATALFVQASEVCMHLAMISTKAVITSNVADGGVKPIPTARQHQPA